METKKKDPAFIILGETLDREEKLEKALFEVEAILREKSPWGDIEKALAQYIKDKCFKSSDETALRAYLRKKYFPARFVEDLKNVSGLKQTFERHKICAKYDAIIRKKGRPLTPEQSRDFLKALCEWDKGPAKKYEDLTRNRRMTTEELQGHTQYSKPFLNAIYTPLGQKLCARDDCLKPLPLGSRNDRTYCSERCKSIMKSRRTRRR